MLQNPYKTAETILFASSKPRGKLKSVDLYGPSVKEKNEGSLCSTFHLENESGTGDIAAYSVFPGMELVYNDMHMKYCNKTQNPRTNFLEINYCRVKPYSFAWERVNGAYATKLLNGFNN